MALPGGSPNLSAMLAALSYKPIPIFELGPVNLSLHGLFAGVGFVIGSSLIVRYARRRGIDPEQVISVMTWALVAAIIGTRAFTIPAHIGDPGYGFSDMIAIAGDYSILGGYAGGIIGGVIRIRMLKLPVLALLDIGGIGMALGGVVGRIGDLAIVEHLGSPTSFFLGFTIKPGYDVAPQHDALECTVATAVDGICGTYHHTALYDLLGLAVLFGVLWWLYRNWRYHYGQLFAVFVAWYGFQRFLVDFGRLEAAKDGTVADSVMGPFTGSQWGALGAGLLGVALFLWYRRRSSMVPPPEEPLVGAPPPPAADEPNGAEESAPAETPGDVPTA